MPGTKQALEDVRRLARAIHPGQFVVSAEHASNRIPAAYNNLGLTRRQLDAHIAWDPGARLIARACAKALGCACHEGRFSRLFVDLNRSLHHPKLMATRSFTVAVPGNRSLLPGEKDRRVRRYYTPFREAVLADVRRAVERYGRCVHLSMHSFTPRAGGAVRKADIGLLYDPQRPLERLLADQLLQRLRQDGFHVRRNYPYRGISDGHVTHLRDVFPKHAYAGLEIEVNQQLLESDRHNRTIAHRLAQACQALARGE
jgi:predicted N-formylglutamate amidohydrolase